MTDPATTSNDDFHQLAGAVLDELLEREPESATVLGDHRFDDRLNDQSVGAQAERVAWAGRRLADLDAVDPAALSVADRVDAEILRNALRARRYALEQLRETEWDPLVANPGTAVYTLLARDFAPLGDRLRSAAGRLAAVPARLAGARAALGSMPTVHVETAIGQFTGTRTLIATELERALGEEPALRREVEPARDAAVTALDEHLDWLRSRLESADGDPRLGAERFSRKLALTLDTTTDADAVLARAESDLERIETLIAETAARLDDGAADGQVRRVLDRLAAEGRVDDATIVGLCERRDGADHGVRPGPGPRHGPRRPGQDHRDARDPPRCRGGLLRPARAARVEAAADLLRGVPDPRGLVGGAGAVVLPRVQRAHAAQPHGARGDAGARAAARAQPAVRGCGAGPQGAVERLVRRGLGGLRRGADGRRRLPVRRGTQRRRCGCSS